VRRDEVLAISEPMALGKVLSEGGILSSQQPRVEGIQGELVVRAQRRGLGELGGAGWLRGGVDAEEVCMGWGGGVQNVPVFLSLWCPRIKMRCEQSPWFPAAGVRTMGHRQRVTYDRVYSESALCTPRAALPAAGVRAPCEAP